MNGNSPDTSADLLKTSEHFLKSRDFDGCRNYVLSSPLYHPTNLTAAQILTLADILSTRSTHARPDYYSILSLTRFTHNPNLIRTRFKTLASLINPNTNPLSLSSEAFSLLLEAYSVLSNPTEKKRFDDWLRISDPKRHDSSVFWTVCPYCYYVYEYSRVYLDCCMRCQNVECRKGFTATEIEVSPPEAVAGSGRYLCLGFSPVGFKGFSSWSPFSSCLDEDGDGENEVEKPVIKRRKSVGVCAKKVMGKGVPVKKDDADEVFMRI